MVPCSTAQKAQAKPRNIANSRSKSKSKTTCKYEVYWSSVPSTNELSHLIWGWSVKKVGRSRCLISGLHYCVACALARLLNHQEPKAKDLQFLAQQANGKR